MIADCFDFHNNLNGKYYSHLFVLISTTTLMVNIILTYYMWKSKFSDSAVTFLLQ